MAATFGLFDSSSIATDNKRSENRASAPARRSRGYCTTCALASGLSLALRCHHHGHVDETRKRLLQNPRAAPALPRPASNRHACFAARLAAPFTVWSAEASPWALCNHPRSRATTAAGRGSDVIARTHTATSVPPRARSVSAMGSCSVGRAPSPAAASWPAARPARLLPMPETLMMMMQWTPRFRRLRWQWPRCAPGGARPSCRGMAITGEECRLVHKRRCPFLCPGLPASARAVLGCWPILCSRI